MLLSSTLAYGMGRKKRGKCLKRKKNIKVFGYLCSSILKVKLPTFWNLTFSVPWPPWGPRRESKIVLLKSLWANPVSGCLCPRLHSGFLRYALPELLIWSQLLELRRATCAWRLRTQAWKLIALYNYPWAFGKMWTIRASKHYDVEA